MFDGLEQVMCCMAIMIFLAGVVVAAVVFSAIHFIF